MSPKSQTSTDAAVTKLVQRPTVEVEVSASMCPHCGRLARLEVRVERSRQYPNVTNLLNFCDRVWECPSCREEVKRRLVEAPAMGTATKQ